MAREKKTKRRRGRTRVPVASRASDTHKPQRAQEKKNRKPDRVNIVGMTVIVIFVLLVLVIIAVPLRNYYQGRSEIARLNESITAKQNEKDALLEKIDKYKSEDYIKQEARRRFGLVEQGETAYRIIDPNIQPDKQVTTNIQAQEDLRPWFEVLWDSVAQPPEEEAPVVESHHLPIEPAPEEHADVR
ncbi:FtsB family cell division protein [Corynebacterium macginleyi]|uniref:Septum formation initiator family protein n=1 Tax=Corynebacterium macginleyi TaxID=38290 RepID=A0A3M0H5Y8_9CORY|nr:septum formation initiator family protein [Corynebacterium macginleyi]MBK4151011.1 septum formation initiator family protein [Corynebacterium macginleyi]MBK4156523.1 septum formation initiator family protein [Corynebacterium macginleyi]MBK4162454.1 septum formation initiator family protein [Corynebacterium macginleyi]MBK4168292.1 septum formation initiator family protein [Corynebacterium macginleyi]MBK4179433.1 septum formation initiator family protein [Corynebacterium macginleyi]